MCGATRPQKIAETLRRVALINQLCCGKTEGRVGRNPPGMHEKPALQGR